MTADTPPIPDRLHDLARRIGRLRPDWRNPERYFAERDELERDARRLAREAGP